MEQWNDGILVSLKDIFHFIFTFHLRQTINPSSQNSTTHYSNIPAFQHSSWGKAPNLISGFPKNKKPQAFSAAVFRQEKIKNRRPWKRPTVSTYAI